MDISGVIWDKNLTEDGEPFWVFDHSYLINWSVTVILHTRTTIHRYSKEWLFWKTCGGVLLCKPRVFLLIWWSFLIDLSCRTFVQDFEMRLKNCILNSYFPHIYMKAIHFQVLPIEVAYIFRVQGCLTVDLINTVNANCILTIFWCQPLKCWNLGNLNRFPKKQLKRSETTVLSQTFFLQFYNNYPQFFFYCHFSQNDQALKVVWHLLLRTSC